TLFRGHIKLGTSAIAGSTLRILAFNVRFEAVVGFDHQCWTSSSGGKWPVDTERASIAALPAICVCMVAPTDASHGLRYACSSHRSVAASRINCTDVSLHEFQLCNLIDSNAGVCASEPKGRRPRRLPTPRSQPKVGRSFVYFVAASRELVLPRCSHSE